MSEPITETTLMARSPGTLWRRVLGGLLVLAPAMDEPLLVSQPGDLIWLLLDEPTTLGTIASALAELYGVEPATVTADIEPTLHTLFEQGAIELATGPDAVVGRIGGDSR